MKSIERRKEKNEKNQDKGEKSVGSEYSAT